MHARMHTTAALMYLCLVHCLLSTERRRWWVSMQCTCSDWVSPTLTAITHVAGTNQWLFQPRQFGRCALHVRCELCTPLVLCGTRSCAGRTWLLGCFAGKALASWQLPKPRVCQLNGIPAAAKFAWRFCAFCIAWVLAKGCGVLCQGVFCKSGMVICDIHTW